MTMPIKIGMPVSYDYKLSLKSLEQVYQHADKIVLAIDQNRLTWAGEPFEIADAFWNQLSALDKQNKITIYEDNFCIPDKSLGYCDTIERIKLADQLGEGGWHIQVDSDEYFVDFEKFVFFLRKVEQKLPGYPIDIYATWVTLFKHDQNGFYVVAPYQEITPPIATNKPDYRFHRRSQHTGRFSIMSDSLLVHQSWARSYEELATKLTNWGHSNDFDTQSYLRFWKSVSKDNTLYLRDIHPIEPPTWKSLKFIPGAIQQLLAILRAEEITLRQSKASREIKFLRTPSFLLFAKQRVKDIMPKTIRS